MARLQRGKLLLHRASLAFEVRKQLSKEDSTLEESPLRLKGVRRDHGRAEKDQLNSFGRPWKFR